MLLNLSLYTILHTKSPSFFPCGISVRLAAPVSVCIMSLFVISNPTISQLHLHHRELSKILSLRSNTTRRVDVLITDTLWSVSYDAILSHDSELPTARNRFSN
jgi:hypothetical protein